jgi:hypothetical protein
MQIDYIKNKPLNTEEKLWKTVSDNLFLFKFVPFLKAVFVCNSLSFGNIKDNSDIDLFVVAGRKRLFIVRFFLTIILHFFRLRRHGNNISGRFCLSFFIDETNKDLSAIALKDDFYLAFWIKNLVLVFSDGFNYQDLIKSNSWIFNLVSEDIFPFDFKPHFRKYFFVRFFEKVIPRFIVDIFEYILKKIQIFKARRTFSKINKDKASIVISETMLKFHNNDKRQALNDAYVKKFGKTIIFKKEDFLSIFPPL